MMRKMILQGLLILFFIAALLILFRTFTYPFQKLENPETADSGGDISALSVKRLSEGLKMPTIYPKNYQGTGLEPFEAFAASLPGHLFRDGNLCHQPLQPRIQVERKECQTEAGFVLISL
jgi:hypothetical protein